MRRRALLTTALAGSLASSLLSACDHGDGRSGAVAVPAAASGAVAAEPTAAAPPTDPPATATTAAAAPTTTAVPAPPDPATAVLTTGSSGAAVQALEQQLADHKFDPGTIDGTWDAATTQAVLSFQKQAGLPRTSKADPAFRARLATAPLGNAMVSDGEPTRVEVDLSRQVLQRWQDGTLVQVIGVSTGSGRKYSSNGHTGIARTPVGRFRIYNKISGLRISDLGKLYDPVYFQGGYAIHGSPSVPADPASHGCVRIPIRMSAAFNRSVAQGTQVIVLSGGAPPLPTGPVAAAPAATPAAPPTAAPTTTAAPATTAPTTVPATTAPPTTAPPVTVAPTTAPSTTVASATTTTTERPPTP